MFDELDSTNTVAAGLRAGGEAGGDGVVVLARHQTAGRGRFGRVWRSRPGGSALLSVILTAPPALRRPVVLTAWAAVAVGAAVRQLAGVEARIKWPNDLLVRGKKISGILIEQGAGGEAVPDRVRTVVGIGVNLNQAPEEFAAAGLPDATSVAAECGSPQDLRAAVGVLLSHLDAEYARLLAGERAAVEADWKGRVGLLGRQVEVELADGSRVAGRLREMGFDGLEVELSAGAVRRVAPEAVEHVRAV